METLNLAGTAVTDVGLAHLRGLTRLRKLILAGTRVTDAGLDQLATFSDLRQLDLEGSLVSQAGIEARQRVLPMVEIVP